ncbi:MAG TPA: hypothetical protein ENK26_13695 [Gammaproteobacteria bacterium]|nr:hypothetical protein [Gammaproteobacteria bacterium]
MLRRFLMTLLVLLVGFNLAASAWAGSAVGGPGRDSSHPMSAMSMSSHHSSQQMRQAKAGHFQKTAHCKLKCNGDCGSDCCASGVCNACGHCAAAALFDAPLDLTLQVPTFSPVFVSCSLEKGEPTPPFRPPLHTS